MGKKGRKVNKLARMSDEERARYLQHRADMEEEARRRKRELIARFIKNKLDKEEAFSRINTAKLNQIWRFILRRIKCKQMAMDIQGMITTFNFMMERKNRLITSLMTAINDSDEQHRRAFQAHTETISDFLGIGTQRLDKLQDEFEHQKNLLLENWDRQEFDIGDNQERTEFKLKLIIYIQDRDFRNDKRQKEMERATEKNNARLEHEDDMRCLRRPKELEIEGLWSRLRAVYNSYMEQHNPIMSHYQLLREKDEFYQRDIARNDLMIVQASNIVQTLQAEYLKTTTNMNSKVKRMSDRKELLAKKYWLMKKEAKSEKKKGGKRLEMLVDASQGAIERLEEAKKKLYKILQLAEICRKFEKECDKIDDRDTEGNERAALYENLDEAMINECKEYSKLDKFMLKMNHVKVQVMCLKAEKVKLNRDNVQLKNYIKRLLTDLALKTEKARPYSVKVESEANKNGVTRINRPLTCIEGALSNAVMHQKRMKVFEDKKREIGIMRAYPRVQNWMQAS